jgi:hypothetical protein
MPYNPIACGSNPIPFPVKEPSTLTHLILWKLGGGGRKISSSLSAQGKTAIGTLVALYKVSVKPEMQFWEESVKNTVFLMFHL